MKKLFLNGVIFWFVANAGAFQILDEGKFLNFSDVHFDPFYDSTLVNELVLADYTAWENIFLTSKIKTFSSYGSDCNYLLFESALKEMSSKIPNPDFIIITGDFMSHNFNEEFEQYSGIKNTDTLNIFIEKTIRFITSTIVKHFPSTVIYPTVGNDDAYCGNYMIDPGGPFLKMLGETWEAIVNVNGNNSSFREDFSKGGYCMVNFPEKDNFKMIILNTVFFSTKYKNLCGDTSLDPGADELNWLKKTLENCKLNNQKVWMSYHIPPGIDIYATITDTGTCEEKVFPSWNQKYNSEFIKIFYEYSSIINSSFAGHFHRDDFRVFYRENVPVSYIHITPSISPIYGNNPAYQIITYVKNSHELLNYDTYYLKNIKTTDSAYWSFEYDFQSGFGQSKISPISMNDILNSIAADTIYRSRYIQYYTADNQKAFPNDYFNWYYNWCGLGNLTIEDYASCLCLDSTVFKK